MVNLQDVEDESFISDVFLNIHKILNSEAASVNAAGGEVQLVEQDNGNQWIGAYPENYIEEGGEFPLGIISTPNSSDVRRGFRFTEEFYTFQIHVFARRAEHPALFISKAWNALKQFEDELAEVGLYNLGHEQTNNDMTMRGEMKVHSMSMPITVRKTRGGCDR